MEFLELKNQKVVGETVLSASGNLEPCHYINVKAVILSLGFGTGWSRGPKDGTKLSIFLTERVESDKGGLFFVEWGESVGQGEKTGGKRLTRDG